MNFELLIKKKKQKKKQLGNNFYCHLKRFYFLKWLQVALQRNPLNSERLSFL